MWVDYKVYPLYLEWLNFIIPLNDISATYLVIDLYSLILNDYHSRNNLIFEFGHRCTSDIFSSHHGLETHYVNYCISYYIPTRQIYLSKSTQKCPEAQVCKCYPRFIHNCCLLAIKIHNCISLKLDLKDWNAWGTVKPLFKNPVH
jgi:hypothetical protein